MNVLLISSYTLSSVSRIDYAPPLNLLYLSAAIRSAGFNPIILDLNIIPFEKEKSHEETYLLAIKKYVLEYNPKIVCFSSLTTSHFPFARKAAGYVKGLSSDIFTVIGGVHASLFTKEIIDNCNEFDFVIIGEGENQISQITTSIFNNNSDFSEVQALGWRDVNRTTIINPRQNYIDDLDKIPIPAWDLIDFSKYYREHPNWYNPKNHNIKISIPLLTTRGCPYNCSFCSAFETMGRRFRKRSPKLVVDEIEYHLNNYGHQYFGFVDDNLTLDKKHVLEICNEIINRNLDIQFESFNGYNLASLDREVIECLARAGCVYAILPIEHGSDYMRNEIIGKNLSREKIFEVMNLYKEFKIKTRTMFIMGFPEETDETLSETKRMIDELDPDMADIFTLIPFPGTRIFKQVMTENLLINNIDESLLWTGEIPLDTKGSEIYIMPYSMSINSLFSWRKVFDELTLSRLNRRTL